VTEVQDNPVNIILQTLISKGGGGTYDILPDGAGIDQALLNISQFETIRDEFFLTQEFNLLLYGIDNVLTYLEEQILYPCELRIISDNTSRISLAILNRRLFDDEIPVIDETTILKQPSYDVDDTNIINVVEIEYDYSEGTQKYRKFITLQDEESITDFGRRDPLSLQLKGVQETLNGAVIANDIGQRFLSRFAYPKPEISLSTHIDKSLILLGEKAEIQSSQIPTDTGDLNFGETLEVIERGINWKTGDVKFKLAFTSFTGIKECYLAPSDSVTFGITRDIVIVGAGRGSLYSPGWKMRLYSDTQRDHYGVQVNEILSVVGDVITFVDEWAILIEDILLLDEAPDLITMMDGSGILLEEDVEIIDDVRIMFADYDEVIEAQKRYCFISNDGLNFDDGAKTYQITL